ncbi:GspH/FimT family pseudopilin [Massilia sp. GCM10020059]|uniref:Type II secretion system protein H n=1 Tax=Massilia agrisoli TaxID=2892444 RepID=A0ABS8IU22_9BURK|nr:GspH/FimT family pseudopilin [Massilia agrisoli]MCC6072114.1 GspH/FimT family pseudopilin [Massilia agrisoli]
MHTYATHHSLPGSSDGFSLSELLATVAIVAIVTTVGLPMLRGFIDDAAVSSAADRMLASLNYTRSEAVKRNTRVTMCRSAGGAGCDAASAAGDWRGGWIIFVDGGDAGAYDDGDEILRVEGELSGSAMLLGTGAVADYVSYASTGQARLADGSGQAGVIAACVASPGIRRRKIALTAGTGWVGVDIVAGSADCTS